jgi:hypothetical protein
MVNYTIDEIGRKIYHRDFIPFRAGLEFKEIVKWGGKAEFDMISQKYDYINSNFSMRRFPIEPPQNIPSFDFLEFEGKQKKFPNPDLLSVSGIGPNQIICSYKFMGFMQKYRMAPHIIAPVVVHHRDTVIDDYYVMVYFWESGIDLVDWDKTIFAWIDGITEEIKSYFKIENKENYIKFRMNPSSESYIPLSVSFIDKYDFFYSALHINILLNKTKNDLYNNILHYSSIMLVKGNVNESLII